MHIHNKVYRTQRIVPPRYQRHSVIKFTAEDTREDGSVSFLDTLVTPEHNGMLTASVYRQLIHTD